MKAEKKNSNDRNPEFACQFCGAPIPVKNNQTEAICRYCGGVNTVPPKEESEDDISIPQETIDELHNAVHSLGKAIRGKPESSIILPQLSDKECEKKVVEKLVITDLIPTDIFNSFALENIIRRFFPVFVFEVNWKADWSATFTKQVSHQEPDYDYKGNRNGTKTVYETLYRDANGTSAGNLQIVLPAFSTKIPEQSSILSHFNVSFEEKLPLTEFDNDKYKGWEIISVEFTDTDAWKNNKDLAKKKIGADVDSVVSSDTNHMAGEWLIDRTNYTYSYKYKVGQCVFLPIWTAEYKNIGDTHGVSVAADDGTTFLHSPLPVDKEEAKKKKEQERLAMRYKENQVKWYWLFGGFGSAAVTSFGLQIVLGWHAYELTIVCTLTAIVAFSNARKWHCRFNNSAIKTATMLFESKRKRQQSAKRKFGIEPVIGKKPLRKEMSRGIDIGVYIALIVMVVLSLFLYHSF